MKGLVRVEKTMTQSTKALSASAQTGDEKIQLSIQFAAKARAIFEELVSQVETVRELCLEIATASSEQSKGVNEISSAVSQLDSSTQQNARSSEGLVRTSKDLSTHSEKLRQAANALGKIVNGNAIRQI